jgi:hypothetical protein
MSVMIRPVELGGLVLVRTPNFKNSVVRYKYQQKCNSLAQLCTEQPTNCFPYVTTYSEYCKLRWQQQKSGFCIFFLDYSTVQ